MGGETECRNLFLATPPPQKKTCVFFSPRIRPLSDCDRKAYPFKSKKDFYCIEIRLIVTKIKIHMYNILVLYYVNLRYQ